jgi:predicted Na+-dependent transporter
VLLASVLPVRGSAASVAEVMTIAGIALVFFLHGAKLTRAAIMDGMRNWRLHLAVLATTFVVFPLLGPGLGSLPLVQGPMAAGLLFLTLLPSTVQSSIAFTAMARCCGCHVRMRSYCYSGALRRASRRASPSRACCSPAQLGAVLMPLMLFHQIKLIACALSPAGP